MGLSKVRRAINKPLGLFGFRVERVGNDTDLHTYLEWLELRHGVPITSVFDIGAHVGTWSTELAEKLPSGAQFFYSNQIANTRRNYKPLGTRVFVCC